MDDDANWRADMNQIRDDDDEEIRDLQAVIDRLRAAHEQVVRLCDANWSPEGEYTRLQQIRATSQGALDRKDREQ